MSKAVLLFSGGLDSILAYKVLISAGVNSVDPIFFETPFFKSEKAVYYGQSNNIKVKIINVFEEYLNILIEPVYGYGKCMNPCIDCHAFMIKKAVEYAKETKAEIIATGEVIGQRPMSQNKNAFLKINKIIEHIDVLRPLSAKLLPETEYERAGFVEREKLLSISGRSRKIQIEEAEKFGITEYPSPSGGCLLTEIEYSKKIRALKERKMITEHTLKLIRYGRFDAYGDGATIIARDDIENDKIMKERESEIVYQIASNKGPVGIVIGNINGEEKKRFFSKLMEYSKKSETDEIIEI